MCCTSAFHSANFTPCLLTRLSRLTSLTLRQASDQQCSSLAQLTGLRALLVDYGKEVSAAGLRQLAVLEQLTSLGFDYQWPHKVNSVLQQHMSDTLSDNAHAMVNKAPPGNPSDVPARLLHMCELAEIFDLWQTCQLVAAEKGLQIPGPAAAGDGWCRPRNAQR